MPTLKHLPGMRERIDPWSLRAVPLTLKCNKHDIGTATGFFWSHEGRIYLLTNWHVLSGRSPQTWQPLDEKFGPLPDQIEYPRFADAQDSNRRVTACLDLRDRDGKTTWLQHPRGQQIDVAAIGVPKVEQLDLEGSNVQSYVHTVNSSGTPSNTGPGSEQTWNYKHFQIGSDVFVVGFPLGLRAAGYFPIWKRASIATEMEVDANDLPCFLIDTATRAGMSGSPVLHYTDETGGWDTTEVHRKAYFAGIYSGRHVGDKTIEAQLGIVWRTEVITQVLSNGVTGLDP